MDPMVVAVNKWPASVSLVTGSNLGLWVELKAARALWA